MVYIFDHQAWFPFFFSSWAKAGGAAIVSLGCAYVLQPYLGWLWDSSWWGLPMGQAMVGSRGTWIMVNSYLGCGSHFVDRGWRPRKGIWFLERGTSPLRASSHQLSHLPRHQCLLYYSQRMRGFRQVIPPGLGVGAQVSSLAAVSLGCMGLFSFPSFCIGSLTGMLLCI